MRPEHQNNFLQNANKNIFDTSKSILYKKQARKSSEDAQAAGYAQFGPGKLLCQKSFFGQKSSFWSKKGFFLVKKVFC